MDQMLASIRSEILACAAEFAHVLRRGTAHSTGPDRLRKQVQRLVEYERAIMELAAARSRDGGSDAA